MTTEQVYKKIKMTKKQNDAWEELMVAFKKCKKEKILFYNCLETTTPMNGRNVLRIDVADGSELDIWDPLSTQSHNLPSYINYDLSGFADDIHKIVLKD